MNNSLEDFLQWWDGFRSAIDPENITKEHLDMIDRKINGLQDLWDISLPTREEQEEVTPWPNPIYGWPYSPPYLPKATPVIYPKIPDIWCLDNGPMHVGTPQNQPHVGTPLRHFN